MSLRCHGNSTLTDNIAISGVPVCTHKQNALFAEAWNMGNLMTDVRGAVLSKVPEVTLAFWIIKIAATTLGETGGDSVTMTWLHADLHPHNGGYLIGAGIFLVVFIAAVIAQILEKSSTPGSTGRPSLARRS